MPTSIRFTQGHRDGNQMVEHATSGTTETITSSGTSQQTTIAAPDRNGVCVVTTTADVWIKFGSSPTASAGNDHLVTAGQTRFFGDYQAGDLVAVIDA